MSNPYENREFMIFNVSELNQINFNEVLETSADTVRTTKEGPYTYDEILVILATPFWTDPNPPF